MNIRPKLPISYRHNKRLKMDCQRVAFPVPLSRG
ncbi:type II toxin-antitoxin system RelE/ParE family toxin, partial [Vibrio tarriae]